MTSFDYYYYQNLSGFEFCANWGFSVNSTSMGLSNLCNKKRNEFWQYSKMAYFVSKWASFEIKFT